jgi:hypothetical protein
MKHVSAVAVLSFLVLGLCVRGSAQETSPLSAGSPQADAPAIAEATTNPSEIQGKKKMLEEAPSLSESELNELWGSFTREKDFGALLKSAEGKGFERIKAKEAAWGFKGEFIDKENKVTPFLFCVYDFYNPKSKAGQGCSMVYKRLGNQSYKAYIVFPEGEKDVKKAFAGAKEWYVDSGAKVEVAHSWSKCFPACVSSSGKLPGLDVDIKNGKVQIGKSTYSISCLGTCGFAAAICGSLVTAITIATGGVSVPVAVAVLLGCAGPCAGCLALCAIGCM